MTTFLLYAGYFLITTVSTLQRRFVIKRKDAESLEQIHFAFCIMVILVIASVIMQFWSPLHFIGNTFNLVLFSLACGLFGMGYFALNFSAQKHLDAGVSNIVLNIYTPITILLSSILLNEGLNYMQIFGTALLLVSIFIISKRHRISRFKFDKYFWYMLLSGVLLGFLLVAERALQKQTGLTGATMLSWVSQCIFLGVLAWRLKRPHPYTDKEVVTTGLLQIGSSMYYVVLLFFIGNLSLVSSVTTFKVVLVFIGAAIFLGEREDFKRKVFGSVLAVIGLLLMK